MIVTAPASTNNDKSDNSGCTAPPNASLPAIAKSDSPQVKNSESVLPRPGEAISRRGDSDAVGFGGDVAPGEAALSPRDLGR